MPYDRLVGAAPAPFKINHLRLVPRLISYSNLIRNCLGVHWRYTAQILV